MRVMRSIGIALLVMLSSLILLRCSDSGNETNAVDFEVREWGVLVGCSGDSSFFLTSRPEVSSLVKLPVIYVHSATKEPFTARATFKSGGPTVTYPPAVLNQNTVEWQNVEFVRGATQEKLSSGKDFVPLESIIPTLNKVDADVIEYGGWLSRFLFYEGAVQFRSKLIAAYNLDALTAAVTSHESFPVYNVNLVVSLQNSHGPLPQRLIAHWNKIDPGQTVNASLAEEPAYSYLADMKAQGFSDLEAQSFAGLWEPTLNMTNSSTAVANLVYRLPQSEYDSLISLSVTPLPDKLVRTLYVLIHLQDSAPDSDVVRKLMGGWQWVQSSGGIGGVTITPATAGYTKTVQFFEDGTYLEKRNDETYWETTYRVYQKGVIDTVINVLQIDSAEPTDIFTVTDSTLELMDECIDCFQHSFRRITIR